MHLVCDVQNDLKNPLGNDNKTQQKKICKCSEKLFESEIIDFKNIYSSCEWTV